MKLLPRKITAQDYLDNTAEAVKGLFKAIEEEEKRFRPIQSMFSSKADFYYEDFSTADLSEDFNELQVQHKFNQMAEARTQAYLIAFSIEVLSGAVLQIAKQGISIVLEKEHWFNKGRHLANQPISNIIWQSRNQSMHWEENKPNQAVKDCFEKLTNEFGDKFDLTKGFTRNRARDILQVLGWISYDDYEKDVNHILS